MEKKKGYGVLRALGTALLVLALFAELTAFLGVVAVRGALDEAALSAVADDLPKLLGDIGALGEAPAAASELDRSVRDAVIGGTPDFTAEERRALFSTGSAEALLKDALSRLGGYLRGERVAYIPDEAVLARVSVELDALGSTALLDVGAVSGYLESIGAALNELGPLADIARFALSEYGQLLFAALAAIDVFFIFLINRRFSGRFIAALATPAVLSATTLLIACALASTALAAGGAVTARLLAPLGSALRAFTAAALALAGLVLLTVLLSTLLKRMGNWRALVYGALALSLLVLTAMGASRLSSLGGRLYTEGELAFAAGDYDQAADRFDRAQHTADSAVRLDDCRFELARAAIEAGDGLTAEAYLACVPQREGMDEMLLECRYLRAEKLIADGRYLEARFVFAELGEYSDSAERVRECSYLYAEKLLYDGDPAAAIDIFAGIGSYKDSLTRVLECWYALGEAAEEAGDYRLAIEQFTRAADWGDAAERIKGAKLPLAKQLMEEGGYTALHEACAICSELSGYGEADVLKARCIRVWESELDAEYVLRFTDEGAAYLESMDVSRVYIAERGSDMTLIFEPTRHAPYCCRVLDGDGKKLAEKLDFIGLGLSNRISVRASRVLDADALALFFASRGKRGNQLIRWHLGVQTDIIDLADLAAWYKRTPLE